MEQIESIKLTEIRNMSLAVCALDVIFFNAVFENHESGVVDVGVAHIYDVDPCMDIREIFFAYFGFVRSLDLVQN
jgi:hypothetical protein